jgi:GTPase SAR1 family protein
MNGSSSQAPLRMAVVGHTNTGKTSLLRTLTRNRSFGEVADRPGVTRDIHGTTLLVGGEPVVELFDTPGLEDSIGLLDTLHALRTHEREDGPEWIHRFLQSPAAIHPYSQEAKAIRQILESDVALYVVDVRDAVLPKHRDELLILTQCARPILPVLNFTARPDARVPVWRQHLSRAGLHAVAEFDSVVVTEEGEEHLFEKLRSLLDAHRHRFDALIADRKRLRRQLMDTSCRLIASLLVDVAALQWHVQERQPWWSRSDHPMEVGPRLRAAVNRMREEIRARESVCVEQLLQAHRFHPDDCEDRNLPVIDGRWGFDLFQPELLQQFGRTTSSSAAAGALAGLAVDAAVGGISLGAAAATGAAIGAVVGMGRSQGRRLLHYLQGRTELRCDDAALQLLAARQYFLLEALLRRGHASQQPVRFAVSTASDTPSMALFRKGLPQPLRQARIHPEWAWASDIPGAGRHAYQADKEAAVEELARLLLQQGRRDTGRDPSVGSEVS